MRVKRMDRLNARQRASGGEKRVRTGAQDGLDVGGGGILLATEHSLQRNHPSG
jgi:hypothetical protein